MIERIHAIPIIWHCSSPNYKDDVKECTEDVIMTLKAIHRHTKPTKDQLLEFSPAKPMSFVINTLKAIHRHTKRIENQLLESCPAKPM
jgi:hypothetical protein